MTAPLLRPDVYVLPVPDGVAFVTPTGIETFTGRSIHAWVERLAPHLDGRRTVDELTDGLPEDKRAMVERTVAALRARGLVRDPGPSDGYLGQYVDASAQAYQRFRTTRCTVVGSGSLATALRRAAERSGLTDVSTVDGGDPALRLDGGIAVHARVHPGEVWIGDADAPWHRLDATAPGPDLGTPAATLVANQMVLVALRRATRVVATPTMYRLDLATLTTTSHRGAARPPSTEPLDDEGFDRRAAALLDPRLGIFTELAEADFVQLPLCVATVRLADGTVLTAAGPDFRTARLRAALRGITAYAARGMADPTGVAAGYTEAAAVRTGLLARCRARAVAGVGTRVHPLVDLDSVPLDPVATGYRRLLDTARIPLAVYDVTGPPGVPAFAFVSGDRTVAYTCATTPADAVREGLELTLLDHQARANGQPAYAPPPVPDLPAAARGGPGPVPPAAETLPAHRLRPFDPDPALLGVVPAIVDVVLDD